METHQHTLNPILIRKILWVTALTLFILWFSACNQTPISPPSSANRYTLEVRGGTTNLDSSFFVPTILSKNQQAARLLKMSKLLARQFGIYINPQSTQAIGVNLFVQVLKDSSPLNIPFDLSISGPQGDYSDPTHFLAGQAWDVVFPLLSKGIGEYKVKSKVDSVSLANSVSINPNTQQLLPIAASLRASATSKELLASWQPVAGAVSYILLIYDPNKQDFIWSGKTKITQILIPSLSLSEQTRYEFTVFALSWDSSQSILTAYPTPLPPRFDASAVSRLIAPSPSGAELSDRQLNFSARPGQTASKSTYLSNIGFGPLIYKVSITGSGISLSSSASGTLQGSDMAQTAPNPQTQLQITGTCPNYETELRGALTITTNNPAAPTLSIPIGFECALPIQAGQTLQQVNQTSGGALAWSKDGQKVAVSSGIMSASPRVIVWDRVGNFLWKFDAKVVSLDWSPDGSRLAGVGNGLIYAWDASTGNQIFAVTGSAPFSSVSWHPSGTQLAVAGPQQIEIHDAKSGQLLNTWPNTGYSPFIAWNPSGSRLAMLGDGVVIYSADGTKLQSLKEGYRTDAFAWSPDGNSIAALVVEGTPGNIVSNISIWSPDTGTRTGYLLLNSGGLQGIAWSPDGSQVATWNSDHSGVDIWQVSSTSLVRTLYSEQITSISWENNGLAVLNGAGLLVFWNPTDSTVLYTLGQLGGAQGLNFSDDSTTLTAHKANDGYVGLYNLQNQIGTSILLPGVQARVSQVLTSHWIQGQGLVSGVIAPPNQNQYQIKTWDTLGHEVSSASLAGALLNGGPAITVVWRGDGKQLAFSKGDNRWQVASSNTGQVVSSLPTFTGRMITWSQNGSLIAVLDSDITIYNALTGEKLISLPLASSSSYYTDWIGWAGNQQIVTIAENSPASPVINVLDSTSGQILLSSTVSSLCFSGCSISPNGKRLAVSSNNTVSLLSLVTGEEVLKIPVLSNSGGSDTITNLTWSPDGNYLAIGSYRETLEVYRISPAP